MPRPMAAPRSLAGNTFSNPYCMGRQPGARAIPAETSSPMWPTQNAPFAAGGVYIATPAQLEDDRSRTSGTSRSSTSLAMTGWCRPNTLEAKPRICWTSYQLNPAVFIPGKCAAGQYGLTAPGACSTTGNMNNRRVFALAELPWRSCCRPRLLRVCGHVRRRRHIELQRLAPGCQQALEQGPRRSTSTTPGRTASAI